MSDNQAPPVRATLSNPSALFELTDPELWLVTARHGTARGGLIATFACRASIVETLPRVLLGLSKQHHTWQLVQASGRFTLHLLYPEQLDLVWRFGLRSGHAEDKFRGLEVSSTPAGNPLLPFTLAWADCYVEDRLDTGDRTVYLAAVSDGAVLAPGHPLTISRLRAHAPPTQRRLLDDLYARDGVIDGQAILQWRSHRQQSASNQ
jgi:flavin reductase (DIM6/NTAB) family NADH-FMN oxidoreductase RutF